MAGKKKRGLVGPYIPTEHIAPDTLFRVTTSAPAREEKPSKYRLEDVCPDPNQARRILPEDLAGKLAAGEVGPREAIEAMIGQAEEDLAVAKRLRSLRKLAASIQRHGLINPVTLRQVNDGLVIETGERRYWAHWLLVLDGHQEFVEIRGELVGEGRNATARQLIENWQREDLNAVEKARGLWALRYALSGVDHGIPPILQEGVLTSGGVDHGIPLIPWGEVQRELGISKDYRIKILRVLYLCAQAQEIIFPLAVYRDPDRDDGSGERVEERDTPDFPPVIVMAKGAGLPSFVQHKAPIRVEGWIRTRNRSEPLAKRVRKDLMRAGMDPQKAQSIAALIPADMQSRTVEVEIIAERLWPEGERPSSC